MKISISDERDIRTFAQKNLKIVSQVVTEDASIQHAEEDFLSEAFQIIMFISFCKSIAELSEHAVKIGELIEKVVKLFQWFGSKLDNKPMSTTLREQILMLVFESFANRKSGITTQKIVALTGEDETKVVKTLKELAALDLIRKARDDSWKYQRK